MKLRKTKLGKVSGGFADSTTTVTKNTQSFEGGNRTTSQGNSTVSDVYGSNLNIMNSSSNRADFSSEYSQTQANKTINTSVKIGI